MKTKILLILVLLLMAFSGAWIYFKKKTALPLNITLYESSQCPHCKNVLKFMQENQISEKITINKKQLDTTPPVHVNEFERVMKFCGYQPEEGLPVPVLWTGHKTKQCLVGDTQIIDYLKKATQGTHSKKSEVEKTDRYNTVNETT